MGQTRLYLTGSKAETDRIYAALDLAFEDDGLPLAVIEIDEDGDVHEVSLYAEEDVETVENRIRDVLAGLSLSRAVQREELPDIDWVAKSLEGLQPVRAGGFFVHGAHDRDRIEETDIPIEIEAGLAFGTGHHGTTAGCLETIARVVAEEKPANALDLGAGSAVLAIALAKLARIPVLATDIDPVATDVAEANVRLNGVGDFVETVTATGFDHPVFAGRGPFALVVANILAGPLMELAPAMARNVAPGGSLVLSGILDRQEDGVLAAYTAQGFRHIDTLHREGWVTIRMKR
ncbi:MULTISPECIES: 50S ribosomal protein L11 methyltransferase [Phyllobacteriaceae]|uniref:Ribosomal protein L11 methyltransferase n=1 Tax=Ollibium composti TaxID=2675109 RepID=A0ABY2QBX1_9HYPH|nr:MULTISPECIES: 50S ribosomal protein L11 methyltransferase [Mesorhizobium]QDC00041.1 50S ribosomal protein L11 methyltransferase [Mesorhizobium sp. 8]THF59588.1 50S ribosomal protein L11 methyltransferase [Mesorhizobium composti]